jgi:putative ABC transport system permease protein
VISAVRRFAARVHAFLRPARADAALARELAAVQALSEERHRARGLTPSQAAEAAARDLRTAQIRNLHRDTRSFPWLEDTRRDVRYAARTLGRTPGFTTLAILTLAVGIGSATVIYSVVFNVLLDPLPYPNADRLVNVRIEAPSGFVRAMLSPGEFDVFTPGPAFEDVVGTRGQLMLLTLGDRAEAVRGVSVTPNFFAFMGLPPLLGRALTPADASPGAPAVAVLRHRAWVTLFGGDASVIGRTITINGEPRTIVGVMPPRFTWHAADLWIPQRREPIESRDPATSMNFQARLRPGVTLALAEAQVTTAAARRQREFPKDFPPDYRVRVAYVIDDVVGSFRRVLYTLLAAVGLLMIMACCNVANMLLAKATVREREMTVRAALGAGRSRIARQLLVESLLLAGAGAVVGCLLAYVGIRLLVPHIPQGPLPGEVEIALNGRVLAASLGLAMGSGLVFGMAPAFYAFQTNLVDGLRGAGKGTSGGRGRMRSGLVVAEIALAVLLVVSAGLLIRSFISLTDVDLGFDANRLLVAYPTFPAGAYTDPQERHQFYARGLERLAGMPGVERVAAASALPPFGAAQRRVSVAGEPPIEGATADVVRSTDHYFAAIGLRVLRGRTFAEDGLEAPRSVAVVNRSFVRTFLGGRDPIGRQLLVSLPNRPSDPVTPTPFEIIGEVEDVANRGLREPPAPEIHLPGLAAGAPLGLLVRATGDPERIANAVRAELEMLDRRVAIRPQIWPALLDRVLYAQPRFSLLVLTAFAGAGLVLVALGVYSVMAYTVSRQSQEIAVRLALGARRQQVWADVLRWTGALVGVGVTIGIGASLATTRVMADQLWNTPPFDLTTVGCTVLVICGVALLACLAPARRAMNVDPMVALRRD